VFLVLIVLTMVVYRALLPLSVRVGGGVLEVYLRGTSPLLFLPWMIYLVVISFVDKRRAVGLTLASILLIDFIAFIIAVILGYFFQFTALRFYFALVIVVLASGPISILIGVVAWLKKRCDQSEQFARNFRIILPYLLIVGAIVVAVVLVKMKPKAERKAMSSMIPVVELIDLIPVSTSTVVQCMGMVIADRETSLEAEVSGRITAVHPGLVEGGLVSQGDVLITMDSRDYELAVDEARAALQRAESSLRLEEGSQAVSQHEMALIGADTQIDPAYQDLMLRKPQLQTAQANVDSARANLAAAQLKLDRTQICAPFDAVVQAVSVSEGDTARSGKMLVKLVARDRLFIRASLPVSSLSEFPNLGDVSYPAQMIFADGVKCGGTLHKILPDLSEGGRMARVLIAVNRPFDGETVRPLLLDEMASVEIAGRTVENVFLMDRSSLRDGSVLWMMAPDERVRICPAELVQGYADDVLVRSVFSNDWKLIISDLPAPVDGMKVRVYAAPEGAL